jgi:hypothetical protein
VDHVLSHLGTFTFAGLCLDLSSLHLSLYLALILESHPVPYLPRVTLLVTPVAPQEQGLTDFFFPVLRIEAGASSMLSKRSTAELYPSPQVLLPLSVLVLQDFKIYFLRSK